MRNRTVAVNHGELCTMCNDNRVFIVRDYGVFGDTGRVIPVVILIIGTYLLTSFTRKIQDGGNFLIPSLGLQLVFYLSFSLLKQEGCGTSTARKLL